MVASTRIPDRRDGQGIHAIARQPPTSCQAELGPRDRCKSRLLHLDYGECLTRQTIPTRSQSRRPIAIGSGRQGRSDPWTVVPAKEGRSRGRIFSRLGNSLEEICSLEGCVSRHCYPPTVPLPYTGGLSGTGTTGQASHSDRGMLSSVAVEGSSRRQAERVADLGVQRRVLSGSRMAAGCFVEAE
jgi:hypothetical protein